MSAAVKQPVASPMSGKPADVASPSLDLLALESDLSEADEQDAQRELAVFRDVFHGDRGAELRAWKAGTHPLHPSQR